MWRLITVNFPIDEKHWFKIPYEPSSTKKEKKEKKRNLYLGTSADFKTWPQILWHSSHWEGIYVSLPFDPAL